MKKSVKYSTVNGSIVAPASKSVAQRAVIAALLAQGTSRLRNLSLCSDTSAALEVARALGATVEKSGNDYIITSDFFAKNAIPTRHPELDAGSPNREIGFAELANSVADQVRNDKHLALFCGESGLLTRMVTPVAALLSHEVEITGHGSLTKRPIDMVEVPLRDLGASISTNKGYLPINVKGPLKGGYTQIDGGLSSQLLTGLLMALPLAENDSEVRVTKLKSRPYVDITIDLLKSFGVEIANENYEIFRIRGKQKYRPCTYNVEGDWSGASCPLVAGAIAGSVTVNNLNVDSTQADKEIIAVLERAGAKISIEGTMQTDALSAVTVSQAPLKAFTFDATDCPDLFPAIVALASCCQGTSRVSGALRLTHKESNRALTLQEEFGKLGIKVELQNDDMLITGGKVSGGEVSAHNDHRIAMALATAALRASGEAVIDQAESVDKSYPGFWEGLRNIGANS